MFKGFDPSAVVEWCRTDLALGRPVNTGALLDLAERLADEADGLRAGNEELAGELRAAEAARDKAERALTKIAAGTRYDGWHHVNLGRRELIRLAEKALAETEAVTTR
jgi:hypothetical protein